MIFRLIRRIFGAGRQIPDMHFADAAAFFEYQCRFGDTELRVKHMIPAIVLDARDRVGTKLAVKTNADGSQLAVIRVASADGGWDTLASTAQGGTTPLEPGDVVAWLPLQQDGPQLTDEPRSAWMGLIVAKLSPNIINGHIPVITRY